MRSALAPALAIGTALIATGAISSAAQGTPFSPGISDNSVVEENQVILVMPAGLPAAPLAEALDAIVYDTMPELGLHLLRFPITLSDEQLAYKASLLNTLPVTLLAEVDRRVQPPESGACTPFSQKSAAVQQCTIGFVDGEPSPSKFREQAWVEALGIPAAQDKALRGTTSFVAVIDNGIDPTHPALKDRMYQDGWDFLTGATGGWDLPDYIDNDLDGSIDEAFGHGTHIAGTIASINPNAMIASYRVMNSDGFGSSYDVARAIWMAVYEGADVINLSLSLDGESKLVSMALGYALNSGVDVYSSVGNTAAQGVLFPASFSQANLEIPLLPHYGVVSVAAVDDQDKKAGFSAWGSMVDISAPGTKIYGPLPDGQYGWWSGTSMATAVASGVGSLFVSIHGSRSQGGSVIRAAESIDGINPTYTGLLGHGRLQASGKQKRRR